MLNIMCGNELSYKAMFRNAELLANSAVCYNHEFANFKMAVKFYFTKFLWLCRIFENVYVSVIIFQNFISKF
jgi:hypothetical protein